MPTSLGIYIDTSILLTLPANLNSAKFQNLLERARELSAQIYTTELCVEEYLEERREQLPGKIAKQEKALEELRLFMRKAAGETSLKIVEWRNKIIHSPPISSKEELPIDSRRPKRFQIIDFTLMIK